MSDQVLGNTRVNEDAYPVDKFNVKVTVVGVEETDITHRRGYDILLHDVDKDTTIVFHITLDEKGEKYVGFELRFDDEEELEDWQETFTVDLSEALKRLLAKE